MAQRINNPAIHHIDKDTGAPLSGGQLFFFEINGTTPKDTFSDEEGIIPNTNPVILDASGVEPDIFGVGSYRVVLQNSNDVQQWERDPVNFEISGAQFSDWLATVDYGVNDIVEGSDGNFYSSIQTPNINNDPTGLPAFWTRTDLLKRWNTSETYATGDPVTISNRFYISTTSSNQSNDPTTDGTNWAGSRTPTRSVFSNAGGFTWNRPDGATYITVEAVGAGAGGGSTNLSGGVSGGGGGAGGYFDQLLDVTSIPSMSVTVGAAGIGATASGTTGGDGGDSEVDLINILAQGGSGGGAGLSTGSVGGLGGLVTGNVTGSIFSKGGDGGSSNGRQSGFGGASFYGGGAANQVNNASGFDGVAEGSGGSGGSGGTGGGNVQSGGDGKSGKISITVYYT